MAVLVTGGAGYIGSHMVWRLLDAGEDVVVIDNLSTGHAWSVPGGAHFIEGNIHDPDVLAQACATAPLDAVVHFAGSVVVPDSIRDPLNYYRNNTFATASPCSSTALQMTLTASSFPPPPQSMATREGAPSARTTRESRKRHTVARSS